MSDPTFYIAAAAIIAATFATTLDALIAEWSPPEGLWTLLIGVATYMGGRAIVKGAGNGGPRNGNA
jgi:hypothetical protein